MKVILAALFLTMPVFAQTISPSQIKPGSNAQVLSTSGGVSSWGYPSKLNAPFSTFQNALDNCQSQVVNVIYDWDSRAQADDIFARLLGSPTVIDVPYGKRHADLLRKELQTRCPSHGTGLVPIIPITPVTYSNVPIWTNTGSFTSSTALGPFNGSNGSLSVFSSSNSLTFNVPDIPWDTLKVYCATDATSTGFTVSIDGAVSQTGCVGTSSNPTALVWTSAKTNLAIHTAIFTPIGARTLIYGAEGTAGTVGVSVHNLAVGSSTSGYFFGNPSTNFAFSDLIQPQALVSTDQLTNEGNSGTPVLTYTANLQNLITHAASLSPAPSVLLFSPMQDSFTNLAPYYSAMKSLAQTSGVGYIDVRDRVGTSFIPAYFGPDGIHENYIGNQINLETMLTTSITMRSTPFSAQACPAGQMVNGYSPLGKIQCLTQEASPSSTCGIGYSWYIPITIPASVVLGSHANFPVALYFNGASANSITYPNLKTIANSGHAQTGADIIVCSTPSGGIQYPHEIVSYTATTGALEMHVRFPFLSSAASTTAYMFYGNAVAPDTSRPSQVFGSSNGYVGVYHFGSIGSANLFIDSTGNNNLGGAGSYSQVAGQFGYYVQLPSNASLGTQGFSTPINLPVSNDARTIEAYYKVPTFPTTSDGFLFEYGNYTAEGNFGVQVYGGGSGPGASIRTETASNITYRTTTADANWHYIASVLPQGGRFSDVSFFFDGATYQPTCYSCTVTVKTQSGPIIFNGDNSLGANTVTESLDEVRISNVARSPAWLGTQYNDFSNPSTFVTLGSETAAPNAPFTGTFTAGSLTCTVKSGTVIGCI